MVEETRVGVGRNRTDAIPRVHEAALIPAADVFAMVDGGGGLDGIGGNARKTCGRTRTKGYIQSKLSMKRMLTI